MGSSKLCYRVDTYTTHKLNSHMASNRITGDEISQSDVTQACVFTGVVLPILLYNVILTLLNPVM